MAKSKPKRPNNIHPLGLANANKGIRHVFIRNFVTQAEIGAYEHETGAKQAIRINLDLSVDEMSNKHDDRLGQVVCYDTVLQGVKRIIKAGHINLVETLAEKIADFVLQDHRVMAVRVRVEKLEAVEETESVGVEIERKKPA